MAGKFWVMISGEVWVNRIGRYMRQQHNEVELSAHGMGETGYLCIHTLDQIRLSRNDIRMDQNKSNWGGEVKSKLGKDRNDSIMNPCFVVRFVVQMIY
ncbi:hypothetical protein C5167_015930 [Papaver somniferum]|nr:hypothetical protein C5167_015930 [Papaver somniferum]